MTEGIFHEHDWENKGLIATDRNLETNMLVYSKLMQCSKCKEIKLDDDY